MIEKRESGVEEKKGGCPERGRNREDGDGTGRETRTQPEGGHHAISAGTTAAWAAVTGGDR
eukprot:3803977-Pyramimonas_sp.AAC.1